MTISYTNRVSRVRLLGFTRLLLLWKASIYKLLYREVIIYVVLYAMISLVYRLALNAAQKKIFAAVVFYFVNFESLIPITFILGFYVTLVAQRWWNQFLNIPWPDRIVPYIANHVSGADERGRMIRRTLIRYLMISETLVFQAISPTAKSRFPTLDHIVEAGIMTKGEKKMFEELPSSHHKYWVPCQWFANLLSCAREEGRILDNYGFNKIFEEMLTFKSSLGLLYSYDWVSIPLVYTQVATISVYIFFFTSLISRQFIDSRVVEELTGSVKHEYLIDLYVPGFTLFQLFFYLGWLKVAEQMINPFGEDDDDFDVNYILDRNFQVGLMAVDLMYCQIPEVQKDPYWGHTEPQIPHTRASQRYSHEETWMGSMAHFDFSNAANAGFLPMDTIQEGRVSSDSSRLRVSQSADPNYFGSNSTFRPEKQKGRLRLFFNHRLDFLKSAPQIHTNSLMDLENNSPAYSPLLHASAPHGKFPSLNGPPKRPPPQVVQLPPPAPPPPPSESPELPKSAAENCVPPASNGISANDVAENLVQAWIYDEKNAFADTDAQNTCLSKSTGNLAQLAATGDTDAVNLMPLDSPASHELGTPILDLSSCDLPQTGSLCDLRYATDETKTDAVSAISLKPSTQFTVEVVRETAPVKHVAFEVDTRQPPSLPGDCCTGSVVSNTSTINSTCAIIGKDAIRAIHDHDSMSPPLQVGSPPMADQSDTNSVASSDSGSAESVIDSVRAMTNVKGQPVQQRLIQNQFGLHT